MKMTQSYQNMNCEEMVRDINLISFVGSRSHICLHLMYKKHFSKIHYLAVKSVQTSVKNYMVNIVQLRVNILLTSMDETLWFLPNSYPTFFFSFFSSVEFCFQNEKWCNQTPAHPKIWPWSDFQFEMDNPHFWTLHFLLHCGEHLL